MKPTKETFSFPDIKTNSPVIFMEIESDIFQSIKVTKIDGSHPMIATTLSEELFHLLPCYSNS